jgi:histidine phosphotransferase ChpT
MGWNCSRMSMIRNCAQRCMDLLAESAKSAADKLKFFRLLLALRAALVPEVDPGEARAVIEPLVSSSGRTELQWSVPPMPCPSAL